MISDRLLGVEGSKSVGLASVLMKLKKEGKDIIALNVGEPDLATPDVVKEATYKAMLENHTRYSLVEGIPELRERIATRFQKQTGRKIDPSQVLVSNGSKQTLYNLFQTLLNPGDEVIIPRPYWVSFPEAVKLAGGIPVFIDAPDLQLPVDGIKAAVTKKTKLIIVNSPNNPSGVVYKKEDMIAIANLAVEKNIHIVSDEAYDALVYDDQEKFSFASLSDEVFNHVIFVQSFSKTFMMTGFRIGYSIASTEITKNLNKLQSHLTGNNCTFAQWGAVAAIDHEEEIVPPMVALMKKRRDLCLELSKGLFEVETPGGAFYLFPKVTQYFDRFKDSAEMATYILEKTGVAGLGGSAFGMEGHLRFAFTASESDLREAFRRMREVLL
ncbi:MAG: aminotransferase class I and II [Bdellovibrionales bacterium CG12_big_fil_rev_8_21_14_0_65_38_15]|nr:MAG: aminotransferase class I and II [Bdellovibrionales bacterium CG22_combo_CG10-13_8_21_14_all_38_13]PIQ55193.1 MAG: aminotransferase class I and II [Bdellovibrionales bacterium CG12_big_fil_rev_8_21_14_0_65_38_15]PIR28390.1 MAG: aminotransferase class I and II [Bdellovibrionales bacterium CG11_big_fil_rev_8_21_14_0_20_38_13]